MKLIAIIAVFSDGSRLEFFGFFTVSPQGSGGAAPGKLFKKIAYENAILH